MSQLTNQLDDLYIQTQRLFLLRQDSIIQNYDQEDELMDLQQNQGGFQELFYEFENIISPNEDAKKQIYFQISDNENNVNFDLESSIQISDNEKNVNLYSEPSIQMFDNEKNENFGLESNIQIINPQKTPEKIPKKKFNEKSYCRYILLYLFRTIENKQYAEIITQICSIYQINYSNFVEYYRKQRILIMGYQSLKKELIYDKDSIPDQNRKKAFKEVLIWYLDKLATKQILLSKKQNFEGYLKFKNYVMSYYIHTPKSWAGNKPQWI
ncbi:unnamed protein product [Paramecium primaurelia]|uniref:Uncharacterized protein n=1 Tax=Paramecium primaurelia TaxID=5886 RepID=A0A8S1PCG9_PARPR|nr:unnamed protein product [Paramecium primaurelia]